MLGCTLFLRGGGLRFRLHVGIMVVWAGWLNRLEAEKVSLFLGGSQSWDAVGHGVDTEGVGTQGYAADIWDNWVEVEMGVGGFSDDTGMDSGTDLSMTDVSGLSHTECLPDN